MIGHDSADACLGVYSWILRPSSILPKSGSSGRILSSVGKAGSTLEGFFECSRYSHFGLSFNNGGDLHADERSDCSGTGLVTTVRGSS